MWVSVVVCLLAVVFVFELVEVVVAVHASILVFVGVDRCEEASVLAVATIKLVGISVGIVCINALILIDTSIETTTSYVWLSIFTQHFLISSFFSSVNLW